MLLGEARGRASLLPLLCGALLLLLLPAPAGAKNEAYAYDLLVGMGDGTVKYFLNKGSKSRFTVITKTYLETYFAYTEQTTLATHPLYGEDVGLNAVVSCADFDGDLDLDCFVGESTGYVKYYKNIDLPNRPLFTEQTTSGSHPLYNVDFGTLAAPFCERDFDGDGDYDCFLGLGDGTIAYYKNTGTSTAPAFTAQTGASNPLNAVAVTSAANLFCADFDADNDFDCLVGNAAGSIAYFKNTGTPSAPAFTAQAGAANPFNGVSCGTYCTPRCIDADFDGDLDCFVGNAGVAAVNAVQTVVCTGTAGTFTLTHGGQTTGSLAWSASALQVQTAFRGLSTVDSGTGSTVTFTSGKITACDGTGSNTMTFTFGGASSAISTATTTAGPHATLTSAGTGGPSLVHASTVTGVTPTGTLLYFQNVGTKESPTFSAITGTDNPFNGWALGGNVAPQFLDLDAECGIHNECNGHGQCFPPQQCKCFDGYGSATDISFYKAPDCSKRVCPAGPAWADPATTATKAHALAECADKGLCDRSTGKCACFDGFTGDACERLMCPTATQGLECSGHGQCVNMKQQASMTNALPLSPITTYTYGEATWDFESMYGCVCDSSWTVGLGSGERQQPEWFGSDCSLQRCPTGQNPDSTKNDLDCSYQMAAGGVGKGESGNICHQDCSGKGECDYATGTCTCYPGYYGFNCNTADALAVDV